MIGVRASCNLPLCISRKKIHNPPTECFVLFCFAPTPRNSSLASYFASKILAFKTLFPLGISDDLPWGGYGFYLETVFAVLCFKKKIK